MTIKPSTALRNEYNAIAARCRETGEPIYITKNGEGDLVVMSIEAFQRREAMLDLREKLLDSEQQRLEGAAGYTLEQAEVAWRARIDEA